MIRLPVRTGKLDAFQSFAHMLSHLSRCKRRHVGAVVIDSTFSQVYAIGYNGPARGEPDNACSGESGSCGCVHAEVNAIAKLQYRGDRELTMLLTLSPCFACAGVIVNCGVIDEVIYDVAWRDDAGVQRLIRGGVTTASFDEMFKERPQK